MCTGVFKHSFTIGAHTRYVLCKHTHLNGVSKHTNEDDGNILQREHTTQKKNNISNTSNSHCPRTHALHFNQCANRNERLFVHFSTPSFIAARAINPQNNYLVIDNKLRESQDITITYNVHIKFYLFVHTSRPYFNHFFCCCCCCISSPRYSLVSIWQNHWAKRYNHL